MYTISELKLRATCLLLFQYYALFTDNRRKCLGNIEEVRLNFLLNKLVTITENLVDVRKLSLAMLSN